MHIARAQAVLAAEPALAEELCITAVNLDADTALAATVGALAHRLTPMGGQLGRPAGRFATTRRPPEPIRKFGLSRTSVA